MTEPGMEEPEERPVCLHGPTFLFASEDQHDLVTKYKKRKYPTLNSPPSPYYSCSASRDHKFCNFRMDQQRWWSYNNKQRSEINSRKLASIPNDEFTYFFDCPDDWTFGYCNDCCRVLVNQQNYENDVPKNHRFDIHLTFRCQNTTSNHPKSYFASPSKLIYAMTANENQAQYFFDDSVAPFVVDNVIIPYGFRKVLCIGCPTIHEQIAAKHSDTLSSFLLDIDPRFTQFFAPSQYAQFNMFNYFFFNDLTAEERLKTFLRGGGKGSTSSPDTLIVLDPPFGGRIDFLTNTIRKIQIVMDGAASASGDASTPFPAILMFFPYFNEHWIKKHFNSELKITDYVVHYSNHHKFKRNNSTMTKEKQEAKLNASPVRVFTNLDRSKIDLTLLNPEMKTADGKPYYRQCDLCNRCIFKSNRHCMDCGECPARDATKPYGHCVVCGTCVKSTWVHCSNCKRCHLAKQCPQTELAIEDEVEAV